MRVYLAGPMRGLPELNFPAFHTAAANLRAMGHEVFSPAENSLEDSMRDALALDLDWICRNADMVIVLDGWEQSLGVRAEIATAEAIGIPWGHFVDMELA